MNDEHRPDDTDEELDDDAEAEEEEQDVEEGGLPDDFSPPVLVEGAEDIAQQQFRLYSLGPINIPSQLSSSDSPSLATFRLTITRSPLIGGRDEFSNPDGPGSDNLVQDSSILGGIEPGDRTVRNLLSTNATTERQRVRDSGSLGSYAKSKLTTAINKLHRIWANRLSVSSSTLGGSTDFYRLVSSTQMDIFYPFFWRRDVDSTLTAILPVATPRPLATNTSGFVLRVASGPINTNIAIFFPSPSEGDLTLGTYTTYALASPSFGTLPTGLDTAGESFSVPFSSTHQISTPTTSDFEVVLSSGVASGAVSIGSVVLTDASRLNFEVLGTVNSGTGSFQLRLKQNNSIRRVNASGVTQSAYPAFAYSATELVTDTTPVITSNAISFAIPITASWDRYPGTLNTANQEFTLRLTFSEAVTGFALSDLTTSNCTALRFSINRENTQVIVRSVFHLQVHGMQL